MNQFESLKPIINKIVELSEETYYNPYSSFQWPNSISEEQPWMSIKLISIYGTPFFEEFTQEEVYLLSKWESINFYSLNVHGIKDLLIETLHRVHKPGYEEPSRYFHHFIGEENEHMYFFSKFCTLYGGKIYKINKARLKPINNEEVENFLVFARILFFEEIVDQYNLIMSKDPLLHPIIRKMNKIHHQDESRHISFNRAILKVLYRQLEEGLETHELEEIHQYLETYLFFLIKDLYNPSAYRDAGIKDPVVFRDKVMNHPSRVKFHIDITKKLTHFLKQNRMITKTSEEIFKNNY